MRFSKTDASVVAAVALLSAAMLFLFARDMNAASAGKGVEPAGTISFRKNSATRRGADSLRWENLRNDSTVYRGDTIRTSGGSEASLHFGDGASLDVFENSMLRIETGDSASSIDLESGALHVGSGAASVRRITSGESTIEIQSGSDVSLVRYKTSLEIDVTTGSASVSTGAGAARTISTGEVFSIDAKTGTATVRQKKVDPLQPVHGSRFVSLDGSRSLEFKARALVPVENAIFEFATDPSFTKNLSRVPAVASGEDLHAVTELEPGDWFWRVSFAGESGSELEPPALGFSPVRKISLSLSSVPKLSFPADAAVLTYRKSNPAIRFSWAESAGASGYALELSRSPSLGEAERRMRTKLTGLSVPALGDGVWYWRVVPEFQAATTGGMPDIPYRRFTVEKSQAMDVPVQLAPLDGNLYSLKEFSGRGILFSWKPVADAADYELRLYSARDSERPLSVHTSRDPWIRVEAKDSSSLAIEGERFWSVVWRDSDGVASGESARRSISGIDERLSMRATFPPDGYLIAASALESVRFSWKRNFSARTVFLLSPDPSFSRIAFQKDCPGNSVLGVESGEGEWYWKARTYNVDGSVFMESDARRIRVTDALPSPRIVSPEDRSELGVLDGSRVLVGWDAVAAADYYSVSVRSADSSTAPVFTAERVFETSLEIPASSMPSGRCRISVQAFAEQGPRSTRVAGREGSVEAVVRTLARVERKSPKDGTAFDGASARRDGVRLEWRWKDKPETLNLSILKDGVRYPVKFSWNGESTSFVVPRLSPGKYTWKIEASSGSVDLSPRNSGYFTVLEIPPLPAPSNLRPADGTTLGSSYFSGARSISFSWDAVIGATSYRFRIVSARDGKTVVSADGLKEPGFVLRDLRCLDRGDFVWEASAGGRIARNRLSISLPSLIVPEGKSNGDFYGF